MIKFSKLKFILLFSTFYFLFSFQASAAKLELVSQSSEIGVSSQLQIDLMLYAQSEGINAVEAEITFPEELLKLQEIQDGDSIINFWVERPKIGKAGVISFSGIIPGGFSGILSPYYKGTKPGKVFSLIFTAKKEGVGNVEIKDAKVLLNDGLGTPTGVKIYNLQFNITTSDVVNTNDVGRLKIKDIDPPELFTPEIASNSDIFDGKWFLVFATQDKGSGIDHYKICERVKTTCVIAESPYVLQNQNLDRKIYIKAIDKSGNERTMVLPPKFAPWYQKPLVGIAIGLIVLTVLLLIIWLWKKIRIAEFTQKYMRK